MDVLPISPASPIVDEPRGTTLADLFLLVAGFGLYWMIPSFGYKPGDVPWLQPQRDLHWVYEVSATLGEMAERVACVLAIIVFLRRIRSGSAARPAEFLLGVVAMDLILTPRAGSMWALGFRSPTALAIALVVLGLASFVFIRWRRRLPGLVLSALAAITFFASTCVFLGIIQHLDRLPLPSGWDRWPEAWQYAWEFTLQFVVRFPGIVLFTAPYVATFWNWGDAWRRWSWIEWSGVILATAWYACNQVHYFTSALFSSPVWYFLTFFGLSWFFEVVGFCLNLMLWRRFGPWFHDWIARR
jgi:hypothetical protein